MIRSALLRRLLSPIIMVMLVWCQTSVAAYAGLNPIPGSSSEFSAAAPCHQTIVDTSGNTNQQRDGKKHCQVRDASYETAKIQLPAIDALPLNAVDILLPEPVAMRTAPGDQAVERTAPPPLILVYGRLLI